MSAKVLNKAPLVEAIVELKLLPREPGDYNLLVGKLAERFQKEYPNYKALTPDAPFQIASLMNLVQHQFRASPNGWPLIQLGPTIFTVNQTQEYDWDGDFKDRAIRAVKILFKAHESAASLGVQSVVLRYIDALEFDWEANDILSFLAEDLKTKIELARGLFRETGVSGSPAGIDFRISLRCNEPKGFAHIRFASGHCRDKRALIMETIVQSEKDEVPGMPEGFAPWLDAAHSITSKWFKILTQGNLQRSFGGE